MSLKDLDMRDKTLDANKHMYCNNIGETVEEALSVLDAFWIPQSIRYTKQ